MAFLQLSTCSLFTYKCPNSENQTFLKQLCSQLLITFKALSADLERSFKQPDVLQCLVGKEIYFSHFVILLVVSWFFCLMQM